MRRLYVQIYLAFVGIVVLFGVLVSVTWSLTSPAPGSRRAFRSAAALLAHILPGPEASNADLQERLNRLGETIATDIAVRGADGTLLASVGDPLPAVPPGRRDSGWIHSFRHGPTVALRLEDGRWLVARPPHEAHGHGWMLGVGLLALAIAGGAWPVARRLTRRLERLQRGVEALGAMNLAARVAVDGKDEVARVGHAFNQAADRIERLVRSQRAVLAAASHELRSPLARMRVALELLPADARPELRERIAREIAELDDLIGEILVASRLEAIDRPEQTEDVDLLGLAAEEAARTGARVVGEVVRVHGDPRLLRRLVRNLLDNARRHGGESGVEVSVAGRPGGGARLTVADRGPGVAEADRERIFEPFYRPAESRSEENSGIGLGLALVRQIARHHGGEARCLPRAGGGTCFEVDLGSPPMPAL